MSNTNPQVELARLAQAALPPDAREALIREHSSNEEERPASLRLLRVGEFAKRSGLSRCSCWRMCKENRLRTVEIRKGSRRIPESELIRLVEGR